MVSAPGETAWSCTGCRRCMTCCPFGIDTQMIMAIAKLLPIGADREPRGRFSGRLTYHDPCQIARNGDVIEEPRYVIRRLTDQFVELRIRSRPRVPR